jgi:hypothetical protein
VPRYDVVVVGGGFPGSMVDEAQIDEGVARPASLLA